MDYKEYQKAFFADPLPDPRFEFVVIRGISLYYKEFDAAVQYYSLVLGPPVYIEGEFTRGWRIGDSWLTVFQANDGNPQNAEATIVMNSPEEAERLQKAFIKAGGLGGDPSDELMYEPIRMCPVQDPFGTNFIIICPSGGCTR